MYKIKDKRYPDIGATILIISLKDNGISNEARALPFKVGDEVQADGCDWKILGIEAFQTLEGVVADNIGLRVRLLPPLLKFTE